MKKILFFSCLTPLFFFLTNCKIGDDGSQIVRDIYSFFETFKLTNVKTEYNVGDVIFMEYSRPNNVMTDIPTGTQVTVPNPTMYTNLLLYDPFVAVDNTVKFGAEFLEGYFEDDDDFKESGLLLIEFGCPHEINPKFKLGIEMKAKGGYLLYPNYEDPFIQFAFTSTEDCSLIQPPTLPDDADFAFVQFFFEVETNLDQFNEYAALFPGTQVDLVEARRLLEEKRAFFIWVK